MIGLTRELQCDRMLVYFLSLRALIISESWALNYIRRREPLYCERVVIGVVTDQLLYQCIEYLADDLI